MYMHMKPVETINPMTSLSVLFKINLFTNKLFCHELI